MKKVALIALAIFGGLAVLGALVGDSDTDTSPNPGVEVTNPTFRTTPTTDYRAEKAALCSEAMDHVEAGLLNIAEGTAYLAYADRATVREFLATAKDFVRTSISAVEECADLAPAEARDVLYDLRNLEDTILQAERSL